jgi:hypothetical protein
MGRPRKKIDPEQVRKLARLGCTQADIAEFLACAQSVISERFRSVFALGCAQSKISLRRLQWKAARAGSVPMLIHLGKQYLGQSDRVELQSAIEPPAKIMIYIPDNGRGDADPELERVFDRDAAPGSSHHAIGVRPSGNGCPDGPP